MSGRRVPLLLVCTGVCFASAPLNRAQEATSANLPDQFQTGEMIEIQKPKKKKAESKSKTIATTSKQQTAPAPELPPVPEETPTLVVPAEDKKTGPNRDAASNPPDKKQTTPNEEVRSTEEPAAETVHRERKVRPRKRPRPAVQPALREPATISAPIPMSISVARSMAISAPLPEYTYEMKRRNLAGSGTCVVIVDTATGTVTSATMFQSTGSPLLDKLTVQTFKSWRFKPGTVSQVRIPVTFE